jgi:hypothetical protein
MSRFSLNEPKLNVIVSAIVASICLTIVRPATADPFDGVYTGKRSLTKGSVPPCTAEEDVSVTISGETLTFTNSKLRHVGLGFYPHQDGSFTEIYQDIGGGTVLIEGRIVGDILNADVSDSTCEHHWHLKKG